MRAIVVGLLLLAAQCFGQQAPIRLDVSQAQFDAEGAVALVGAISPEQTETGERDGRWVISMRVSSPGAHGLQFLFEDVQLPAGAKLALYELDAAGQPVFKAQYEGSGPMGLGQFWSDAVAGSEAVIETIFEGEAGSLPFRLTSVRHLTQLGLARLGAPHNPTQEMNLDLGRPEMEGTTGTALLRGVEVPYTVVNGKAVFEGDIVLGNPDELELPAPGKVKGRSLRESMGVTSTLYRWPGGVIPYVIDAAMPAQYRITDAINHWQTKLGGMIRLAPRTNESLYVRFAYTTSAGTCSSYIGKVGVAGQPVTIGNYCSTGNVIHEIGHAVGLFHEHTREDRDYYVKVNWANIQSSQSSNFLQNNSIADDLGAYDYGSIMHYPSWSFSANGQPTIETIPPGIPIGQRAGLSAGDIAGVQRMYASSGSGGTLPPPPPPTTPPPPPPPPSVVSYTVSSNPSGRQVVVDGTTVTAPVTYSWTVGSQHTVSAPSYSSGSTRYLFSRWSDSGAQTHTVTTPSSAATVTASFVKQHLINASSSNTSLGTVAKSPATADSFYNEGSTVTVSAAPVGSACLSSWSGISAPPGSPVTVTVNQPYGIVGNFAVGSVTLPYYQVLFSRRGGKLQITVTANAGCTWTATSSVPWIKLLTSAGTGVGTLSYSVDNNTTKLVRYGYITVGNRVLTIIQNK